MGQSTREFAEKVSIHAPVRERQGAMYKLATGYEVSIHAPVRERRDRLKALLAEAEFQSTPP